jgi:hypothetical protein
VWRSCSALSTPESSSFRSGRVFGVFGFLIVLRLLLVGKIYWYAWGRVLIYRSTQLFVVRNPRLVLFSWIFRRRVVSFLRHMFLGLCVWGLRIACYDGSISVQFYLVNSYQCCIFGFKILVRGINMWFCGLPQFADVLNRFNSFHSVKWDGIVTIR